ncbi:MAG: nickel-dependent hydrogenase large subunit [Spirochaetota bacterium]|nr:nickel-dependent hydrogenase large subunit [Spirochaetota bacterium]
MAKILIDPISRIEGHLAIEIDVRGGKVVDAKCLGNMFRGYEMILKGRNPVDAMQITQRICGVCPISHGIASVKNLDSAFGIIPNKNGRLLRNLTLAANYLQSHILHFYHLAALDFVDITALLSYEGSDKKLNSLKAWAKMELETKKGKPDEMTAVAPFLPRFEHDTYIKDQELNMTAIAHYVEALDLRMKAHQMVTIWGGKVPHTMALVPGGMTQVPTKDKIKQYGKILDEVEKFVNEKYLPDVIEVAKGYKDYFDIGKFNDLLSYGLFEESDGDTYDQEHMLERGVYINGNLGKMDVSSITEAVKYSRYISQSNLHPSRGKTSPKPTKSGAYSWLKAPRYKGKATEVGPVARAVVAYMSGNKAVKKEVDGLLKIFNADISAVFSVLGRHACKALESKLICQRARVWLEELEAGGKPRNTYRIPDKGDGMGLTEAPRGALGHWITIKNKKIANYQCVVPTTWDCSPKDDKGRRGPVEVALIGTPIADPKNPIEAARVVRSYDPCIACAVHVIEGDRQISRFRVS